MGFSSGLTCVWLKYTQRKSCCEKLVNQLIEYDQRLYKDALTGVYNRRYFEEQIKKKNENAGVAVIDMDDFKLCNDTLGFLLCL